MDQSQHDNVEIIVCPAGDGLARCAAELLEQLSDEASVAYRSLTVALSGGSTPRAVYDLLAGEEYAGKINWPLMQIFWSDERFVPPDDPNSNYKLAWDHLLSKVPIPEGNIHAVATAESKKAEHAAKEYEIALRGYFDAQEGEAPRFDLIILGLGDDGHTASLFPGKPALDVTDRLVVDSPPGRLPPPVERVTFTFPVLNNARHAVFLVSGEGKAGVVAQILGGSPEGRRLPAARVRPIDGKVTWILDEAAASKLPEDKQGAARG